MRLRPLLRPVLRPLLRTPVEVAVGSFYPTALYANGEQGFLYINDLSTMYQDSAGTIPAVLEQPVGLWLDSRFGGVRGAEQVTNGNFSNGTANWTNFNGASHAVVNGELVVTNTAGGAQEQDQQGIPFTVGEWYEITCDARLISGTSVVVLVETNAVNLVSSGNITTSRAVRYIFQVPAGTTSLVVRLRANGVGTQAGFDNVSVKPLPGNHATQPTSANRPTLKQDAKGNYYVHFNGTNQWMQTGSVDFTGTDKMTVFSGVTKLSDAARGLVVKLSSGATGLFQMEAPSTVAGTFSWRSVGTTTANAGSAATFNAPISAVLTGVSDIAGDVCALSVNRVLAVTTSVDQGTGTYGSGVVVIGADTVTGNLPFNGDIYCLSARGAQTTDSLIAQTERWLAARQGLSL